MRGGVRDTIAAIASAPGAGPRAVLRVSGPRAADVAGALLPEGPSLGPGGPRAAIDAVVAAEGAGRQRGLVLWMPGPRSFTGEDVAELHLLGHPAWTEDVLGALLAAGARLAEPGEFTRRAFENGRIDLTRAEGVAALVEADSAAEARAALALLEGGLEERIDAIRDALEDARMLAEASLDFDEADTGHVPSDEIEARCARAAAALEEATRWERRRAVRGRRPTVVLAGAPNAGKSTLFNRLARDDVTARAGGALVSAAAGTTRDLKRGAFALASADGAAVEVDLVDTAGRVGGGFRGAGALDLRADERAARAIRRADVVVWVADAAAGDASEADLEGAEPARVVLAWNKRDAPGAAAAPPPALSARAARRATLSGATGEGVDALLAEVAAALGVGDPASPGGGGAGEGGGVGLGARHLAALDGAAASLARGRAAADAGAPLDLVAEELRAATDALDAITGRTAPEDLLSRIFARFCLGK